MSSRIGRRFGIQLFGESHGPYVGVTLDGLPAGKKLNMDLVRKQLARRSASLPGRKGLVTARRESDEPLIVSGLKDGITTGQPFTALFSNENRNSSAYDFLPDRPRPGHADYPAFMRSSGADELAGGGHHSGRLTLPYVFAGALALQFLNGVRIGAHLLQAGPVRDLPLDPVCPDMDVLEACGRNGLPVLSPEKEKEMKQALLDAREAGDSLGGIAECAVTGLPAGWGAPYFEGAESVLADHLFSIPAVKGVEFGDGFACAAMHGSGYNDAYIYRNGEVRTETNHAGGLLGGITTGMPVIFRAAFRPTASVALPQHTVDLSKRAECMLKIGGRHDPCVAVRAVPVVESAAALALLELKLESLSARVPGNEEDYAKE